MQVRHILQGKGRDVVAITTTATIAEAARLLTDRRIGALVVRDGGGALTGIISERDLVRAFARNDVAELKYLRARDVMTTRVVVCSADDTMQHAQEIMRENRFRHLPVAENGHVKGMLSLRDTLATRLAETEEEKNVLRDVLIAARGR